MMRKVMYQLSSYILLFSLLLLLFSCYREDKCPEKTYLPVNVSPIQLEYKVGDTLTISSKFPRILEDISGDAYTYEGDFLCNFRFVPFDSDYSKMSHTSEYFNIISSSTVTLSHYTSSRNDYYDSKYNFKKDSFRFTQKVVLKKNGIGRFGFKAGGVGPPLEASKNCIRGWKYGPPWVISMNGGVNHNFELLSELDSATVKALQRDPQQYNESGCYLMKIVE